MTSSKVIEAHPYRKAITTMDTTWCVSVSKTGKVEQTLIVIHVPLHLQNMNVFNIDSVSDTMK